MGPIQQRWSPSGVYDNKLLIIPQHTGKLALIVTMTVTEVQHPPQSFYQPMNVFASSAYKILWGCWRQYKVNVRTSPKKTAFLNLRNFSLLTSLLSIQVQSSTVQGEMGGQARGGWSSPSSDRVWVRQNWPHSYLCPSDGADSWTHRPSHSGSHWVKTANLPCLKTNSRKIISLFN